jgi:IclR family KDG regulon transcriptional repressor
MSDEIKKTTVKSSGHIQSIERAFAIIEETALHRDGIKLSDLSRKLNIHTSTLFHIIKTLTALGYLRQVADSKRYCVGRAIYSLSATCYDELELSDIVTPSIKRLAKETGESTHFAIWERDQTLILARTSGTNAFQVNERVGMLRPIHCTAIGKALLSGLSDEEVFERTKDIIFEQITQNSLKNQEELIHQVKKVRAEGVAYDDCEYNAETRCIAAPVRDFRGHVMGAIGFSGPIWRMSLTDLADRVSITKKFAEELSCELGYNKLHSKN